MTDLKKESVKGKEGPRESGNNCPDVKIPKDVKCGTRCDGKSEGR